MTIPTIGRTVIVHGISSNGSTEHPAIITRVWADRSTTEGGVGVNLTVFPDCAAPRQCSSVVLHHTEEQARTAYHMRPNAIAAYWPPRA